MKKINLALSLFFLVFCFAIILVSCKKEQVIKNESPQGEPNLPAEPFGYAEKHLVNNHLATLGRVLFYDKNLSVNNEVACGSCHKQEFAFADNVRFNQGFNGIALKRNSPSIQGIRGFVSDIHFSSSNSQSTLNPQPQLTIDGKGLPTKDNQLNVLLFWDGRQSSAVDMVLNPVLNHNEMNMPGFDELVTKLTKVSYYPALFNNAFGDNAITKEKIAFALEGFISCLNTDPMGIKKKNGTSLEKLNVFTPGIQLSDFKTLEEQGKFLFHSKYNCATCHDPFHGGSYAGGGSGDDPFTSRANIDPMIPAPFNQEFNITFNTMFNIGLDEVYADNGLGAVTKKQGDKGVFKVPTLQNISLTAPYMHDGRFSNLGEVIDHYSHNIKANVNLSGQFLNADKTPKRLNINPSEKNALIAFLNTLKDEDFITNPMYSDPFKN